MEKCGVVKEASFVRYWISSAAAVIQALDQHEPYIMVCVTYETLQVIISRMNSAEPKRVPQGRGHHGHLKL